jgi:hypothetical protein
MTPSLRYCHVEFSCDTSIVTATNHTTIITTMTIPTTGRRRKIWPNRNGIVSNLRQGPIRSCHVFACYLMCCVSLRLYIHLHMDACLDVCAYMYFYAICVHQLKLFYVRFREKHLLNEGEVI